jgi:hypothetical protein
MAKRNSKPLAPNESKERTDLGAEASAELDALLGSLLKQLPPSNADQEIRLEIEPAVIRAVAIRARELNNLMLAVIARDKLSPTKGLAQVLHG